MIAIRAGQLIDGIADAPLQDAVILVDGERINWVGAFKDATIPEGAQIIDATNQTVIPGLIDAHVHVHTPGGATENYALAEARLLQGHIALRALSYVNRALKMGFTTMRSLSSPAYVDVALRDAINEGTVTGPRLLVAGQGLTITGGHMDEAHWSPEMSIAGKTGVCDGPWEARKAVRTQCKRGVDVIKINACASGVARYTVDPPWAQEMTLEEISAICNEAHKLQRRVAAHTSGGQGITDAIESGVDSLEHAHWLTDEQIELMVKHGTFYVPTLIVNSRSVSLGEKQPGISSLAWQWLIKAYHDKWDSLKRAQAAGVKIVTGSDAGFLVNHGENACELEELVKGGFTPMQALHAATRVAADCLNLQNELGTLEQGKYADLVVVDGNPLTDIRILQDPAKISKVYKGGQLVA